MTGPGAGWTKDPSGPGRIVAAMKSRRRALSTSEIAKLAGKTEPSTREALHVLRLAGVVSSEAIRLGSRGKTPLYWSLTGEPVPEKGVPACRTRHERAAASRASEVQRYDHHALAAALRMDVTPPAPVQVRCVVSESS
jgi:predicted ArsR family transcriptional regulator